MKIAFYVAKSQYFYYSNIFNNRSWFLLHLCTCLIYLHTQKCALIHCAIECTLCKAGLLWCLLHSVYSCKVIHWGSDPQPIEGMWVFPWILMGSVLVPKFSVAQGTPSLSNPVSMRHGIQWMRQGSAESLASVNVHLVSDKASWWRLAKLFPIMECLFSFEK